MAPVVDDVQKKWMNTSIQVSFSKLKFLTEALVPGLPPGLVGQV